MCCCKSKVSMVSLALQICIRLDLANTTALVCYYGKRGPSSSECTVALRWPQLLPNPPETLQQQHIKGQFWCSYWSWSHQHFILWRGRELYVMFLPNSPGGFFVLVNYWAVVMSCNDQLPVMTNNFLFVLGKKAQPFPGCVVFSQSNKMRRAL